jgi:hypothetical protein
LKIVMKFAFRAAVRDFDVIDAGARIHLGDGLAQLYGPVGLRIDQRLVEQPSQPPASAISSRGVSGRTPLSDKVEFHQILVSGLHSLHGELFELHVRQFILSGKAADGAAGADGDLTRMREEPIPRFVRIPAREFAMGSDEGADDERPSHRVQVDSFYASAYPITIEQYAEFTRETAHGAPGIRDLPRGCHADTGIDIS